MALIALNNAESRQRRRDQLDAALEEISESFSADPDDDSAFGVDCRGRPFRSFRLFGRTWASMSRPFYERLPELLRALADRLLAEHKLD